MTTLLSARETRPTPPRLWRPARVLVTREARAWPHGVAIAERASALGCEVVELAGDRLPSLKADGDREAYRLAKSTLAVVVASPAKRRLQLIPPSADWRFDLAQGCHAHCQYCYLAGSLAGPPITRVYANVEEILGGLGAYVGLGAVTSASAERADEGTTFEASCYADPMGVEHLTGSLTAAVRMFGAWEAPVQLRFTTKFADVDPLIGLEHAGRVRVRMSVNAAPLVRLEGATSPLAARLHALGRLARDGYKVGLTVAPIQPVEGWREAYESLFAMAAAELAGAPDLDLTAELITHPLHPQVEGGAAGLVPGQPAGDERGATFAEADQVRLGQARLPRGDDARAARRDHRRAGAAPARRQLPVLDLSCAQGCPTRRRTRADGRRAQRPRRGRARPPG